MFGVSPVGERVDAYSSAGHEIAGYLYISRVHKADKVFHYDIDAILMEVAMVTEGEEVQLERLTLHHFLAGNIGDKYMSEVGLSGLRAEGRELRAIEGN